MIDFYKTKELQRRLVRDERRLRPPGYDFFGGLGARAISQPSLLVVIHGCVVEF